MDKTDTIIALLTEILAALKAEQGLRPVYVVTPPRRKPAPPVPEPPEPHPDSMAARLKRADLTVGEHHE